MEPNQMSSYKTTHEVKEEAKEGKPNPYLQGTWAWIEYQKAMEQK
jgi:hypothetical protein